MAREANQTARRSMDRAGGDASQGGRAGTSTARVASRATRNGAGTPTSAQLQAAAETVCLLSTPIRRHLVWLLVQQDRDVGSLAGEVGATVAAVSQHLAKLRLAGLVSAHRDGRRQVYTVDDPHVAALVDQIFNHIAPDGSLTPNW